MKRIAFLFLFVTLFYNVIGFYLMFAEHQEQVWVNSIENSTTTNFEVIEVTINPYAYIVDSGIEDTNEDFVIDNKVYHVFKKRIINNVLKLYCLKNDHREVLSKDLTKIVNNQLFDTGSSKEDPSKKLMKSFIKDYIPQTTDYIIKRDKRLFTVTSYSFGPTKKLLAGYLTTNDPPPDFV
jgi:hypothetical protein